MSIFSFQIVSDFSSSAVDDERNSNDGGLQVESGDDSISEMLSGLNTDSTAEETVLVDAPSVISTDTPQTPVYGDHGAISGLPAGTFVEIYREHISRSAATASGTGTGTSSGLNAPQAIRGGDSDDASLLSMSSGFSHSQLSQDDEDRALTIVSSAASGVIVEHQPPVYEDAMEHEREREHSWPSAYTSESRPIFSSHLSISTTESTYRELASLQDNANLQASVLEDTDQSRFSLPVPYSVTDSCTIADSSTHSDVPQYSVQTTHCNEFLGYDVQNPESEPVVVVEVDQRDCEWFAFFTEQDWGAFREDAAMILNAIQEDTHNHDLDHYSLDELAFLTASPLAQSLVGENQTPPQRGTYSAADVLPPPCLCTLCKDAIVGASILDCGCAHSAVCMACWEERRDGTGGSIDSANLDEDMEPWPHIYQNQRSSPDSSCPSCKKTVRRAVPCHALDAAILHCVERLPEQHLVQAAYYHRLTSWRAELKQRILESQIAAFSAFQELKRREKESENDRLLAELIAEEERYFWNENKRRQPNPFVGVAALAGFAVLAATSALTGRRCGVMRGTLIT